MPAIASAAKIKTSRFFFEWKGHPINDLARFHQTTHDLRPNRPIVYLAGDSSLDNKAWVHSSMPVAVPEIYEHTLKTIENTKQDVAFWLNHFLGNRATCINTAVEASLLRERDGGLLEHDAFIRDHITPNDILIVSVGANDIALSPNTSTIQHMLRLAWISRRSNIEDGSASALPYFRELFRTKVEAYISRMVERRKPRAIIVCMIYYPLEAAAGQSSWADAQLTALGYNKWPGLLQAAIKQIYESATKNIRVDGSEVLPCPLFEVLDCTKAEEYTARVEPNAVGGRKMAERFSLMLEGVLKAAGAYNA